MTNQIYYYLSPNGDNPFSKFLDSLDRKQQAKILRLILQIEKYGLISILPHTKKLFGTPFWELRIIGKDNIRVLYATIHQNSILIIHGFIKKSQKTPSKELAITFKRFQDWQLNH